jgi:hypothetical protein
MLFPGHLPRRASLVLEGGRAVRLVLGIIPMLILAGTIEGFISPSDLPFSLKMTLAVGLCGLLALYLKRKSPSRVALAPVSEAAAAKSQ